MDVIILTIIGFLSRLVPHPANVTAVGALALFSGARLSYRKALITMLMTMFISDIVLGFHSVMWATYGSMFLAVNLGRILKNTHNAGKILGGTTASALLFFFITNFAVWLTPNFMYSKSISGLMECYIMALPFFRNSLLGDVFYAGIFFGAYELVASQAHRTALLKVLAGRSSKF